MYNSCFVFIKPIHFASKVLTFMIIFIQAKTFIVIKKFHKTFQESYFHKNHEIQINSYKHDIPFPHNALYSLPFPVSNMRGYGFMHNSI